MLITFSGMVGSGKSKNAQNTLLLLQEFGHAPHYLRFRMLGWWQLFNPPSRAPWQMREESSSEKPPRPLMMGSRKRRLGLDKRLTTLVFVGYLLRILRFRIYRFLYHRHDLLVLNRYFYDNLAQFRAVNAREQKYLRLLLDAIPKPDLAFLMVVRPETALQRRASYHRHELQQLAENYARIQKQISRLMVIATDNLSLVDSQIEKSVRAVFHQEQMRLHEEKNAS
ncbi:hypothetical protein DCC62_02255 [candidate division KSB1 bacterium]|nr:MAG: hypothetical protein DCC62_02255 [candidate division KSB1 bacterium]